jgi:hypothetical protein
MAFIFVTKKGSSDAKIRIWNMDGQRSIPLWRAAAEYRSRGPDVLKGHTKAVVGLAACKNLVYMFNLIINQSILKLSQGL